MNPLQLSPRSFPTPRFTPSASGLSNGHAERLAAGRAASAAEGGGVVAGVGGCSGEGDMLTTPNPYDSFPPSATGADFPMKEAETTPPPPSGPQEPPRDLPLVSELGLRSPCDGVLAKRRKLFKDMKQVRVMNLFARYILKGSITKKIEYVSSSICFKFLTIQQYSILKLFRPFQVSSNSAGDRSDSNSCDTPTSSQNSPRDMTMKASGETTPTSMTAPNDLPTISSATSSSSSTSSSTSRVQVKLEFPDSSSSVKSPTAAIRSPFQSRAMAAAAATTDSAGFKHPSRGRPSAVAAVAAAAAAASAEGGGPSQAHGVMPSPLALVPSPNLSAIERNFGSALLKTPKLLDINVFDFIPERANLPLSSSRSPGGGCCDVSGRDGLPRSPRFSIPEAPTDLSNKSPAAASTGSSSSSNAASHSMGQCEPPPYPSEAEDLSVNSRVKMADASPPSPPQQPTHTLSQPPSMQQPPQLLTLKQEYVDPAGSRYDSQSDRVTVRLGSVGYKVRGFVQRKAG